MLKTRHIHLSLLFLLIALVLRKVFIGYNAMNLVRSCKHQVSFDSMIKSEKFQDIMRKSNSEDTLVLMQNRYAINMTLNWLCNTVDMPGVHERALLVSLDKEADDLLALRFPSVRRLKWIVPCLDKPFNYGDGLYQLFFLFRSNFARAMVESGKSFWMIQQDTFWRRNLLTLNFDNNSDSSDILFDRAAEQGGSLIAGGYYRARSTAGSKAFFQKLSSDLEWWYSPDNTYMTTLCAEESTAKCGSIPFNLITNWHWLYNPHRLGENIPFLIQFDGFTKLGGKLNALKELGFYFLNSDGMTCNSAAVSKAIALADNQSSTASLTGSVSPSYSHLQFGLYQLLIDQLYKLKITEWFLNRVAFPYAHYFMITI
uniref:Nucleotid_trans domain-containing protein n=1 Tax=Steinernema glaseri TaxID=37863 RepID=A0A1I7Y7R0_9BILA